MAAVSLESIARQPSGEGADATLVGTSPSMHAVRERLAALHSTRTTVLLSGETGTGKGLVARLLHAGSSACRLPFVHLDCGALAPSMIESELFGHERGAFTGALERRPGRFERAGRGTLFLDEVTELPPMLQAKLLRILHDREYERVGGGATLAMEARVVAATSRELDRDVSEGGLRRDLYYRLAVVELRLPPLRERLEDLPSLVRNGLSRLSPRLGLAPPAIEAGFVERLARHHWPGNVRELMNLLERLLVERPGTALDGPAAERGLAPSDRSTPGTAATARGSAIRACEGRPQGPAGERERIASILTETGGNVARAARRLGLPRSTLRHRIVRQGLSHLIPRD